MVNYPNGKHFVETKNVSYSRRGMSLEDDLNNTNLYYLNHNLAAIYKKPTPITITKVDYQSRSTAKITEAFFQNPSTTDYNGVYKGKYIDFEAKETHSNTSLALSMIHPHQIKHMQRCYEFGGIVFVIVRFVKRDETYFLSFTDLMNFINNNQRKSIPYNYFTEKGILIDYNYTIRVDYLKVVDSILGGINHE